MGDACGVRMASSRCQVPQLFGFRFFVPGNVNSFFRARLPALTCPTQFACLQWTPPPVADVSHSHYSAYLGGYPSYDPSSYYTSYQAQPPLPPSDASAGHDQQGGSVAPPTPAESPPPSGPPGATSAAYPYGYDYSQYYAQYYGNSYPAYGQQQHAGYTVQPRSVASFIQYWELAWRRGNWVTPSPVGVCLFMPAGILRHLLWCPPPANLQQGPQRAMGNAMQQRAPPHHHGLRPLLQQPTDHTTQCPLPLHWWRSLQAGRNPGPHLQSNRRFQKMRRILLNW